MGEPPNHEPTDSALNNQLEGSSENLKGFTKVPLIVSWPTSVPGADRARGGGVPKAGCSLTCCFVGLGPNHILVDSPRCSSLRRLADAQPN